MNVWNEVDDLAGRGSLSGPTVTTGRFDARRERSAWGATDVVDDDLTTIIPIESPDHEQPTWEPADWDRYYRPTHSEITQDILLPEHEFDAYADEPLDLHGAWIDDYATTSSGELTLGADEELPFRTRSRPDRKRGKHRIAAPPTALRGGRAALIAVAAGAAVAAVAQVGASDAPTPMNAANVGEATPTPDLGPGVAAGAADHDMSGFTEQLAVGKQAADAKAEKEALARRPMFVSPLPLGAYQFTSTFAMRWGSFHGGVDFAAPLGTPIHAATDGVVIEAGPASGYGNWVQVRAADGTVTMYGHMASSGVLVQKGQHVTAGDVIALVGNEGFSTGPHCHFEVWKGGTMKIDPAPWLAEHGVKMSAYTGA